MFYSKLFYERFFDSFAFAQSIKTVLNVGLLRTTPATISSRVRSLLCATDSEIKHGIASSCISERWRLVIDRAKPRSQFYVDRLAFRQCVCLSHDYGQSP